MKIELLVFAVLLTLFTSCDLSISNNTIHTDRAEETDSLVETKLFRIEENGKFGFINLAGEVVITPQFDEAGLFSDGLVNVKIGGVSGKWGYVNEDGKYVINPRFDEAKPFSVPEELARVKVDGKWGCINKEGNFIINPQFEWIGWFSNGLAKVSNGVKEGYIDREGIVICPQFDDADYWFDEGMVAVGISNVWGYVDKDGKYAITPQFDRAERFSEGLASVKIGDKWGFIDKEGKLVINPQFDGTYSFSEGLALVEIGGKWGFIDMEGTFVIDPQFDEAYSFVEGLADVKIGDKWGYISKEGKMVINPQFDKTELFVEGLAIVEKYGKWGYIDKEGRFVINPRFDKVDCFDGLARVEIGDIWGYINKEGEWVWQSQRQDNISKLYCDVKSRGYKDSEEVFRSRINGGVEKRKALYKELKSLGMKADEASFMEYIGYPIVSQNKVSIESSDHNDDFKSFISKQFNFSYSYDSREFVVVEKNVKDSHCVMKLVSKIEAVEILVSVWENASFTSAYDDDFVMNCQLIDADPDYYSNYYMQVNKLISSVIKTKIDGVNALKSEYLMDIADQQSYGAMFRIIYKNRLYTIDMYIPRDLYNSNTSIAEKYAKGFSFQ